MNSINEGILFPNKGHRAIISQLTLTIEDILDCAHDIGNSYWKIATVLNNMQNNFNEREVIDEIEDFEKLFEANKDRIEVCLRELNRMDLIKKLKEFKNNLSFKADFKGKHAKEIADEFNGDLKQYYKSFKKILKNLEGFDNIFQGYKDTNLELYKLISRVKISDGIDICAKSIKYIDLVRNVFDPLMIESAGIFSAISFI